MNPQDNYTYETSGFDGFFSRSIDSAYVGSLGGLDTTSTETRQDASQLSGRAADAWRLGRVQIDVDDVRLSKEGVPIEIAEEHQIVFRASDNAFKISDIIKDTYVVTDIDLAAFYARFSFQNPLGRIPDRVEGNVVIGTSPPGDGSVTATSNNRQPLPYMYRTSASQFGIPPALTIHIADVRPNEIDCYVGITSLGGLTLISIHSTLFFTIYLMDMTNPPD